MAVITKRIWADRTADHFTMHSENAETADKLRHYLVQNLPGVEPGPVQKDRLGSAHSFDVQLGNEIPQWKLHDLLVDFPNAHLVSVFPIRIAERPHFIIHPCNLAVWVTDHGEDVWWTVDGDAWLASRLDFPCPPDELAAELNKRDTVILVADPELSAQGEELTPADFDRVNRISQSFDQALFLSWKDGAEDWLLSEDEPMSGD